MKTEVMKTYLKNESEKKIVELMVYKIERL